MMEPMRVISLGWGVQSFTLAAMVALGELEPIAAAIHSDTTHEAKSTYAFAKHYTPWLEQRGVRVVTVTPSSAMPVDQYGGVMIPAHIEGAGIFDRQCTDQWKRAPIKRWLQANRVKRQPVEMWLGISTDEVWRLKPSHVKYITHRWPLIERRMSRLDCINWLEHFGLMIPEKSACVFCPFKSHNEWRHTKGMGGNDWAKACNVDEQIRKARQPGDLFVHKSRQPLALVDFSTAEDHGQLNLWNEECSGYCGV